MNKYERIINNLDCKIEILKINKPYSNCPECCQKDIDDLQEIKTAMEELVEKNAKLDNENFDLRMDLSTEEEISVMLETRIKKLEKVIEILKRILELPLEDDFEKVKVENGVEEYSYLLRVKSLLNEEEYKLLKEVFEIE